MKKHRRILTMILILAMTFGLSLTALADELQRPATERPNQTGEAVEETAKKKIEEFVLGDEVTGYGVLLEETEPQKTELQLTEDEDSLIAIYGDASVPTEAEAYRAMIALKGSYPEGMPWTNDNGYKWKGGIFGIGYGCAGFAFILSDQAFDSLPARRVYDITIKDVHVGDILRVNNDSHSVVIMEVYSDHVVLAEGNFNSSIHWGRIMTASEVAASTYLMTRYPIGTFGTPCTLTYDPNGGSSNLGTQVFEKGQSVIIPATEPINGIKTFRGWARSATATAPEYLPGDSFKSDQNVTLYAVWGAPSYIAISNTLPKEYTVKITAGGKPGLYSFTPTKSTKYIFEGFSGSDTTVEIQDTNGSKVGFDDDGGEGYDFKLSIALAAGRTYYILPRYYSTSAVGSFTMKVSTESNGGIEVIPNALTWTTNSDGTAVLTGCNLTGDIVIPEKLGGCDVVGIVDKLFYGKEGITSVTLPKTMREFDHFAYIFSYCYDLKSITVAADNPYLCSVDGVLYSKDKTVLYNYPVAKEGTTFKTLPETTYLCCTSFASAEKLTSLYLTNKNVTWAGFTFFNTPRLKVYYLPDGKAATTAKSHIDANKCYEKNTYYPTFVLNNNDVVLAAPVLNSVSSGAQGVTVNWNAVSGAAKYRVFYRNGTGAWSTASGDVTGTSKVVTGLTSGKEYSFLVRCVSADGSTLTSPYDVSKSKSITYIAQPVLTSVSNTTNGVEVKWNAVGGAAKYRVFYKTAGGSWTTAADVTTTSRVVTGLTKGTAYTFTVRCVSADGKTYTSTYDAAGKTITYQPVAVATLASPAISSLSNETKGVEVKWNAVSGAAKYRVFYRIGTGAWSTAADVTGTSTVVTGLTSGKDYSFLIRCVSADGSTLTSPYDVSKSKSITYIAQPVLTSVSNTTNGVEVKWNAVGGAAKYRVFYKTAGGSWSRAAETTSTSAKVTGLTKGTSYTFTVRCVSADGNTYTSAYDAAGKTITYQPVSNTNLTAPEISSLSNTATGVQVTWGAVAGAAKYRVFYRVGTGNWTSAGDVTGTSKVVNGLASGYNYSFIVRCVSADGSTYTSAYDVSKSKNITFIAQPVLTSATTTSTGVELRWNPVAGAAQYRVFYKTDSTSWTRLVDTQATILRFTGLRSGTYIFTVRCVSADGSTYTSTYDAAGKTVTIK